MELETITKLKTIIDFLYLKAIKDDEYAVIPGASIHSEDLANAYERKFGSLNTVEFHELSIYFFENDLYTSCADYLSGSLTDQMDLIEDFLDTIDLFEIRCFILQQPDEDDWNDLFFQAEQAGMSESVSEEFQEMLEDGHEEAVLRELTAWIKDE